MDEETETTGIGLYESLREASQIGGTFRFDVHEESCDLDDDKECTCVPLCFTAVFEDGSPDLSPEDLS